MILICGKHVHALSYKLFKGHVTFSCKFPRKTTPMFLFLVKASNADAMKNYARFREKLRMLSKLS